MQYIDAFYNKVSRLFPARLESAVYDSDFYAVGR